jgi:hypothetical protein
MVRKLPVFRGYTVDERLRQFRKIPRNGLPEFIDFDSAEGTQLLLAFIQSKPIEGDIWQGEMIKE